MFISQSAVSQTIKELENELGVILFERMYKKLYLTEDGKLLKEYARRLLNLWNDMTEHMQSKKKNVPWWFIFFLTLYRFGANLPPNNKAPAH